MNPPTDSPADPRRLPAAHPRPAVQSLLGWRRLLLFPLGLAMRLWGASLRFETSPETLRALRTVDVPVAFVLWHNRLFLTAEIFRRFRQGRRIYGLVSPSKDGAWLDAFFSLVGIHTVRGSSSKLGREAVNALVEVMRAGHDVGITPDGPRGPRYAFKAGALIVARRVQAPLLLLGASFESSWQLRSWDQLHLPKPFSKIRLQAEWIDASALKEREAAAQTLQARLISLNPDNPSPTGSRPV